MKKMFLIVLAALVSSCSAQHNFDCNLQCKNCEDVTFECKAEEEVSPVEKDAKRKKL